MKAPGVRSLAGVLAVLAGLFVALSFAVAAGQLRGADVAVSSSLARAWQPGLMPLWQGIALFGGTEATGLVCLGIFIYLWRHGYRIGSLAVGAWFGTLVVELIYKRFFVHPGPPASISHPDGPSLTDLFDSSLHLQASFPSGHMTRTVVAYGLLAFLVSRLAASSVTRRVVTVAVAALLVIMAFDRVYLEVHWVSDVLGGLLLGFIGLAVAVTWLELRGEKAVG